MAGTKGLVCNKKTGSWDFDKKTGNEKHFLDGHLDKLSYEKASLCTVGQWETTDSIKKQAIREKLQRLDIDLDCIRKSITLP